MADEDIREIARRIAKNGGVGSKKIIINDNSLDAITKANNESYRILEKLRNYCESPKIHFFGIGFYFIKK